MGCHAVLCCFLQDGVTPIHRACWGSQQRHTDTVRMFLEDGKVGRLQAMHAVCCKLCGGALLTELSWPAICGSSDSLSLRATA